MYPFVMNIFYRHALLKLNHNSLSIQGGVAEYRASEGKTVEVEYRGDVNDTILDILGGLRSACTYVGAGKVKEMPKRTTFIRVTQQVNEVFGSNFRSQFRFKIEQNLNSRKYCTFKETMRSLCFPTHAMKAMQKYRISYTWMILPSQCIFGFSL